MRLITIDKSSLKNYTKDPEMLQDSERPSALVIQLKYKGRRYDFAVPLRSNISGSVPKEYYYPLPPRNTTRPGNHHGIHYIKMFPIKRAWIHPFHTENNMFASIIKAFIDKNEKQIVKDCQMYLQKYEAGDIPEYATDIDLLLEIMMSM